MSRPNSDKTKKHRVLVIDDHATARESVADVLRHGGYRALTCSSATEGLRVLEREPVDVVITDLQMPGMSGLELVEAISEKRLDVEVLMITAHASISSAVQAMRWGAFDYLEKPFDAAALERSVEQACQRRKLLASSSCTNTTTANQATGLAMVGSSTAMEELRQRVAQVAATDETVLICGESGTGKELVAQMIHELSPRKSAPLVSLNCPVLSAQLTESELFGHKRGAFTGADADRVGRFEMASGGSILLDEVTEIDLQLQAKLLRVLQERCFERVGSSETIAVDVRVMATSNRNLQEEVQAGRLREDLFYRLAVLPLEVPPLRKREGDVPELVDYYLQRAAAKLQRPVAELDARASELLIGYHWPGNVRELQNVITRACVLIQDRPIRAEDLQPWLQADEGPPEEPAGLPVGTSLEEVEQQMILATLQQFDGHRGKTAEALGIGVRTLSGKLRSYGYAPREKNFAKAA